MILMDKISMDDYEKLTENERDLISLDTFILNKFLYSELIFTLK